MLKLFVVLCLIGMSVAASIINTRGLPLTSLIGQGSRVASDLDTAESAHPQFLPGFGGLGGLGGLGGYGGGPGFGGHYGGHHHHGGFYPGYGNGFGGAYPHYG